MTVEAVLAVIAGVVFLGGAIKHLIGLWGERKEMPERLKADMSETDVEMAEKTKNVIGEVFGAEPVETMKGLSNKERTDRIMDFAHKLAAEYGLDDIDIDITVDRINTGGYYRFGERKVFLNVQVLTVDESDQNFEFCLRRSIQVVIHELRHAVQDKAIREPGFWNVDEARRIAWADNMNGNYINANVDFRGYQNQPIESDAFTFADLAMEGVC